MSGESTLKKVSLFGISLVVMVVVLGIVAAMLRLFVGGMVWASELALPWLNYAGQIAFEICAFVLVPLGIFKKTRFWAGVGYYLASFVFGTLLFAFSCIVAFQIWSYAGLIVGLFFFGFGVVPVAFLATLFHAEWNLFWQIVLGIVLTFGTRFVGMHLSKKPKVQEEPEEIVVLPDGSK